MKHPIYLFMVLLVLLLVAGCEPAATPLPVTPTAEPTEEAAAAWPLAAGQFVFIDHHMHTEGECTQGTCDPGPQIDFPTYGWDEENGRINAFLLSFEINDSLKVIYGNGASLAGIAGGGAGTRLEGVYELPFTQDTLVIERIEADGTAYLTYQGQSITLKVGEEWRLVSEEDVEKGQGKAHLITTDWIRNYGILTAEQVSGPQGR